MALAISNRSARSGRVTCSTIRRRKRSSAGSSANSGPTCTRMLNRPTMALAISASVCGFARSITKRTGLPPAAAGWFCSVRQAARSGSRSLTGVWVPAAVGSAMAYPPIEGEHAATSSTAITTRAISSLRTGTEVLLPSFFPFWCSPATDRGTRILQLQGVPPCTAQFFKRNDNLGRSGPEWPAGGVLLVPHGNPIRLRPNIAPFSVGVARIPSEYHAVLPGGRKSVALCNW